MSEDRVDSAGCQATRALLKAYSSGELDPGRESQVWTHLARCESCRDLLAESDPSVLFMELRSRPLPGPFWAGFMPRLRERIDADAKSRFDWRALFRYPRLAYLTAPVVMLLLLGGTLFVVRPTGRSWLQRPDGLRSPYERPMPQPVRPRIDGEPDLHRPAPRGSPGAELATVPLLEEVGSPDARVYLFTVRDSAGETPIYLVVDESIDF